MEVLGTLLNIVILILVTSSDKLYRCIGHTGLILNHMLFPMKHIASCVSRMFSDQWICPSSIFEPTFANALLAHVSLSVQQCLVPEKIHVSRMVAPRGIVLRIVRCLKVGDDCKCNARYE